MFRQAAEPRLSGQEQGYRPVFTAAAG